MTAPALAERDPEPCGHRGPTGYLCGRPKGHDAGELVKRHRCSYGWFGWPEWVSEEGAEREAKGGDE